MGRDKAFLPWAGGTLLSHVLQTAGAVAGEVRIVGDTAKFCSFGQVVEDLYRERGPLGGIHAALLQSATELNLMLAVDLPFLEPKFLDYLLAQSRESDAVVCVPRAGGRWQPLCAVYRQAFANTAEQALREGKNKVDALFTQVKTRVIEEDELARAGFSGEMFRNLNTPEDLKQARSETRSP